MTSSKRRIGNRADRIRAHIHPQGGPKMVLNITHCHPAGVQRDDHVVEICQPACAPGHHPGSKRARTIPGHGHSQRAVPRVNRLGVRPVAVVTTLWWFNLGLHRPAGMTLAQMGIHFRLQTSVNRCLQQAFNQVAGVIGGPRQLANQLDELQDFPSASRGSR